VVLFGFVFFLSTKGNKKVPSEFKIQNSQIVEKVLLSSRSNAKNELTCLI